MVHNEVGQEDHSNVTPVKNGNVLSAVKENNTESDLEHNEYVESPVQGDSRCGGLRQVIDQRWPAATSGRKWEGLRPVMVHHL